MIFVRKMLFHIMMKNFVIIQRSVRNSRYFKHFPSVFDKMAQFIGKNWTAAQRPTWVGRPWIWMINLKQLIGDFNGKLLNIHLFALIILQSLSIMGMFIDYVTLWEGQGFVTTQINNLEIFMVLHFKGAEP
jgi:hypothetical protein